MAESPSIESQSIEPPSIDEAPIDDVYAYIENIKNIASISKTYGDGFLTRINAAIRDETDAKEKARLIVMRNDYLTKYKNPIYNAAPLSAGGRRRRRTSKSGKKGGKKSKKNNNRSGKKSRRRR